MPFPMVHFRAALLAGGLPPPDRGRFYLGLLAPDAVNMRRGYGPADRDASHLTAEDACRWRSNVSAFLREGGGGAFRMGYAAHIYTDILWQETLYGTFTDRYGRDPSPGGSLRQAYVSDMSALDVYLYRTSNAASAVRPYLEAALPEGLPGLVTADEVRLERDRTFPWYEERQGSPVERPLYIAETELDEFLRGAAADLSARLKEA